MTRNEMKAKLKLMENLYQMAGRVRCSILDGVDADDGLFEALDGMMDGASAENTFMEMDEEGFLSGLQEGEEIIYPELHLDQNCFDIMEIKLPFPDGGFFLLEASPSDFGTRQAALVYEDPQGALKDLALAEIKKGALAVIDGKTEDNQDIDIMVYTDEESEDWTEKYTLNHDTMAKWLHEFE